MRPGGSVECWGITDEGRTSPPSTLFKQIVAAYHSSCGITVSNTLECWGSSEHGQSSPPDGEFSALAKSIGSHYCAIRTNGSTTCWGNNSAGQTDAPSAEYSLVTVGGHHSCGVLSDTSTIQCWGDEDYFPASSLEFEVETGGDLLCTIDEESTDDDGDSITYTFDWDVDGTPFEDTDTSTEDGDSVPSYALGDEEMWTCEVTPTDGDDDGYSGSATHLIEPTCERSTQFHWIDNVALDDGSYTRWLCDTPPTASTGEELCIAYYHDYAGGCSDRKWTAQDCNHATSSWNNGRLCERLGTAGCDGSTYDGSCYSYQAHDGDWYDARLACEAWGGDLVSAPTEAESEFVESMLPGHHRVTWIGMTNATGASECF